MSGSSFGSRLRLTSFGESHGKAIGGILDGLPSGFSLDEQALAFDMARRRPGQSAFTTSRKESDAVQILSGLFEGKTLGTPIGFMIENGDQKSGDYDALKHVYRPGHGDYTYQKKYGIRDHRGGGRASARETAVRVAAGSMAKQVLQQAFGVSIIGFVSQIGSHAIDLSAFDPDQINANPFYCPDPNSIEVFTRMLEKAKAQGNSLGAQISVIARGVPSGLGEPVYERLDAQLAKAMMSINAAKAVAIGDGFDCVDLSGSSFRDQIDEHGFNSNHSGGILAGISTGQDVVAHVRFKPTSSISQPIQTQTVQGETLELKVKGRHDPCVGIRAVAIVEAMMALTLLDFALIHFGQTLKHQESALGETAELG